MVCHLSCAPGRIDDLTGRTVKGIPCSTKISTRSDVFGQHPFDCTFEDFGLYLELDKYLLFKSCHNLKILRPYTAPKHWISLLSA
jgi:hypothetical protein